MKRRVEPKPTFDGELGCHLHISDAVNLSVSGVSALAAPVFDESGNIVLSLTAIGPSALFDVGLNGGIATTLKALGKDLSQRLGYRF